MAAEVIDKVREAIGLRLRGAQHARDLGVDASLQPRRRRIGVSRTRLKEALRRGRRLRKLTRRHRKTRGLAHTNCLPKATWGQSGRGMAPAAIRSLRSAIASALAARRKGGCLTTAIAITMEPQNDPRVTVKLALLLAWVDVWRSLPEWRECMKEYWMKSYRSLHDAAPGRRWRSVTGHIEAVIATLLDAGWYPTLPTVWRDKDWVKYVLDYQDSGLEEDIREIFKDVFVRQNWEAAASFRMGQSLTSPPRWDLTRRFLDWARKKDGRLAGALEVAMQGGVWLQERRHAAGYAGSPACSHCGHPCESELHALAVPPHARPHAGGLGPGLGGQSCARGRGDPTFWYRGLASEEQWQKGAGRPGCNRQFRGGKPSYLRRGACGDQPPYLRRGACGVQ